MKYLLPTLLTTSLNIKEFNKPPLYNNVRSLPSKKDPGKSGQFRHDTRITTPSNASRSALAARMAGSKTSPETLRMMAAETGRHGGILPSHLLSLQEFARRHNTIVAIRPVDKMAAELIQLGHPTKGFHVKGKSANWGPQTSLIPVDQNFSKLQASPDRVEKFSASVQDCLKNKRAVAIPLDVAGSRLETLEKSGLIHDIRRDPDGHPVSFSARAPDGKTFSFQAQHLSQTGEPTFRITHKGQPIEVLAPRPEAKPLTADYDLFVVAPHVSDFGPQDNLQVHFVTHGSYRDMIGKYKTIPDPLQSVYRDAARFHQKGDPEIGNTSPRIRQMIPLINEALVGKGEPVIHHSTDSGNPVANPADNYPLTFTLPTALGDFPEIGVVHDSAQLAKMVRLAKQNGYHFPTNPLWEDSVTAVSLVRDTARSLEGRHGR